MFRQTLRKKGERIMKANLQKSSKIQDSNLQFQIGTPLLRIIIPQKQEIFWLGLSENVYTFGETLYSAQAETNQTMWISSLYLMIPEGTILPGDPTYKLNFSVRGVIQNTIDGFLIAVPIFDEEGYGETYESAWDDLLSSIRDKYASLAKMEQGLSPPDRKVLSELRKNLSETQ
jgi:hypothetical protein